MTFSANTGTGLRALFAILVVMTMTLTSAAQTSPDRALAESLFQEGRLLMEAGNPEGACLKFAESQRLEAAVGTSLNLATCYEALDKTASAWAEFATALSLAERDGDRERAALAEERLRALNERLSRIVVAPAMDNVRVSIDGRELQQGAWGSPLPLDPGLHEVRVTTEGYEPWSTQLELPKGPVELRLEVPKLQPQVTAPKPEQRKLLPSNSPPPVLSKVDTPSKDPSTGASVGLWTALGVSAGALVVGGIATFDFYDQRALIRAHCVDPYCDDEGLAADKRAHTSAMIADVSYGVAAVAGLVAGYLWLSWPSSEETGFGVSTVVAGSPGVSLNARY